MSELAKYLPDAETVAWKQKARCIGLGERVPDMFFPQMEKAGRKGAGSPVSAAIESFCAPCPVRDDCLYDAVSRNEVMGWWGGIPPRGRREIRRLMRVQGFSFAGAAAAVRANRAWGEEELESEFTEPIYASVG